MKTRQLKHWIAGLTILSGAALLVPPTQAHPRGHRHNQHHHRVHARAVIVVGDASPARRAAVAGARHGVLDLNIKPRTTEVWVNGRFRGTCGSLDGHPGKLHLPVGLHDLRLVLPDGTVVERQVRVEPGVERNVGLDLR